MSTFAFVSPLECVCVCTVAIKTTNVALCSAILFARQLYRANTHTLYTMSHVCTVRNLSVCAARERLCAGWAVRSTLPLLCVCVCVCPRKMRWQCANN